MLPSNSCFIVDLTSLSIPYLPLLFMLTLLYGVVQCSVDVPPVYVSSRHLG